jgi:hypothetical protein
VSLTDRAIRAPDLIVFSSSEVVFFHRPDALRWAEGVQRNPKVSPGAPFGFSAGCRRAVEEASDARGVVERASVLVCTFPGCLSLGTSAWSNPCDLPVLQAIVQEAGDSHLNASPLVNPGWDSGRRRVGALFSISGKEMSCEKKQVASHEEYDHDPSDMKDGIAMSTKPPSSDFKRIGIVIECWPRELATSLVPEIKKTPSTQCERKPGSAQCETEDCGKHQVSRL